MYVFWTCLVISWTRPFKFFFDNDIPPALQYTAKRDCIIQDFYHFQPNHNLSKESFFFPVKWPTIAAYIHVQKAIVQGQLRNTKHIKYIFIAAKRN